MFTDLQVFLSQLCYVLLHVFSSMFVGICSKWALLEQNKPKCVLVGAHLNTISIFKWESLRPFQHRRAHVHLDSCRSHMWIWIYQPINKLFLILLDKAKIISLQQPIYYNLCSCVWCHLPSSSLSLHQHPSSQLSSMACGLTMLVNIYCFFCMIDMESLVSLLLQRVASESFQRMEERGKTTWEQQRYCSTNLGESHWISAVSSAEQSGNRDCNYSHVRHRNQAMHVYDKTYNNTKKFPVRRLTQSLLSILIQYDYMLLFFCFSDLQAYKS